MYASPDFERIMKTVNHEEPDRVPLCEVLVEYPIQSQFLGREVTDADLESQVEFWVKAGYDFIPLTAGMMKPGKVTEDSVISQVIREDVLTDAVAADDDTTWNLEYTSFINDRRAFEEFPWETAGQVDISEFHAVKDMLPDGMKVIVVSGKIFTLSWMLMGFENFSVSLLTDEQFLTDVMDKITEIQMDILGQVLQLPHVGAVWAVDDAGTGNIQAAFFDGDAWMMPGASEFVSVDGDNQLPWVCLNDNGDAVAVWHQDNSGDLTIQSATFSNSNVQTGMPEFHKFIPVLY